MGIEREREMPRFRRLAMILTLALALGAGAASAFASESLERFLKSGTVDPASTSVLVIDLSDGKVLESHNAGRPLVPASIMKSVTTATLLQNVGKDYRYETPVWMEGDVKDGALEGNLVVEGACDPSLGTDNDPGSTDIIAETVKALKGKGITRIEGDVTVDQSAFAGPACPPSWMSADLPHSYGTGSHGLNYADNSAARKSVKDPSAVFLRRLRQELSAAGITVAGGEAKGGKRRMLVNHLSAPVDEIMRSCMMRSDNLFAESMLRTYSHKAGGDGSTADGARRELEFWKKKGLDSGEVEIVDGSGLSRSNRMTAEFMGDVLSRMSGDAYYASYFPLAGQEGTLKNFLADTPLDSYVALKTGSMKGIQCYAGYKLDDDYAPTHVIVIMINNLKSDRSRMRQAASRMLLDIFAPGNDDTKE